MQRRENIYVLKEDYKQEEQNMAVKQTAGRNNLGGFAPKFAELNDDVLFGQVWSREDKLCLRDRSLITVVALLSQGLTGSSFENHLKAAKANGISRNEIAEIITHAAFYAGWPKAWAAFRLAKEIWADEGDAVSEKVGIFNVTFEPGCRNHWHIHHAEKGGGQILVCVGGRGFYQEWDREPVCMTAGDVVNIPAGVKHWHGAASDSWFSHLAVEVPGENGHTEWCEPVSDKEYAELK